MIRRILIALDPDSDTIAATRYAIEIAGRYRSEITALAVVDVGSIESETRGGGIGSMFYAEKLRQQLTDESKQKAKQLLDEFEEKARVAGVSFAERVSEGVPYERIIDEMKYHDLLVVGKEPHFFYSRPEHNTRTIERILKDTIAPVLVVPQSFRTVNNILIAFDGSDASARSMRQFLHLLPFGTDPEVHIVTVYKDKDQDVQRLLRQAKTYLESFGISANVIAHRGGNAYEEILQLTRQIGVDMVVAGAHSGSIFSFTFGSVANRMVKEFDGLIMLDS